MVGKMKAIILAAGMGTRLGKYTEDLPKCMLSFGGKTLIERQVETLRAAGADADLCDEIEHHATGIFMASAYHEMTGKRIGLIVEALGEMESRIARVIARWEEEAAKA